jgi:hypothetical protein
MKDAVLDLNEKPPINESGAHPGPGNEVGGFLGERVSWEMV